MRQIPIYYINLASRPERRSSIEQQMRSLCLEAIRVEAIVPADLTDDERDKYCSPHKHPTAMTPRQYACNLSHAKAWAQFVESGEKQALFLEDDAILSRRLPLFLDALGDIAAADIIRIETWPFMTYPFDEVVQAIPASEVVLRTCLKRDAGAAGYILSRAAALTLARDANLHTRLVDTFLFDPQRSNADLKVRYSDPGLCIQMAHINPSHEGAKSSIAGGSEDEQFRHQKRHRRASLRIAKQIGIWRTYSAPKARMFFQRLLSGRRSIRRSIPFASD